MQTEFRKRLTRSAALAVALIFSPWLVGGEGPSPAPAAAPGPAPALYRKVFLIGASVSAGFCTDEALGGSRTPEFRFRNYLDAALTGAHEPVVSEASKLLFFDPGKSLGKQVEAANAAQPSLVLGLDALFWFCYGSGQTSDQRLAHFEEGLKLLEKIDLPLVVGDLPDASRAVGGILSQDEMPEPEILVRCNQRLKSWASGRPNVVLFPLAEMMKATGAGEEFTFAGRTWAKGKSGELLQGDHLHPSPAGLAALAVATLQAADPAAKAPAAAVRSDLDAIRDEAVAAGVKQAAEIAELRRRAESPLPPPPPPAAAK